MKISKSKIAIVGCGLVRSTTAFSLITQGICDEVLMIDINKERAYAHWWNPVRKTSFYMPGAEMTPVPTLNLGRRKMWTAFD